ncbi:unnamed protein product [Allacma fusca]|uniref:Uncharacterized protein n=1 Tax=Allacma fusca TaxID=39272 RepID=A0A8J2JBW4_9HEXA|nr:unnamed protein product [Allacma fusca]
MKLLTFVGIVLTVSIFERLVVGTEAVRPPKWYKRSVEEKSKLEPEVTIRQIAYTGFNPSSGVYTVLSPNYNNPTAPTQDFGNDAYSWGDYSQFGPSSNGYSPSSGYDYLGSGDSHPSFGSLDGQYQNLWDLYNNHGLGHNNGPDFDHNGNLPHQYDNDSGELGIPSEESSDEHSLIGHVTDSFGQTVDSLSTSVQNVLGK